MSDKMADWNKIPTQTIQAIIDRSGDPATVAWAHDGQGKLTDLGNPMLGIAAAAALGNVTALQSVDTPKDLRKAAGAALHRLRSAGVRIEKPATTSTFSLAPEQNTLPSRAFVSVPDQLGNIELMISASDDEGSCVFGLILGGEDGVLEASHSHVSRSELRETWKTAQGYGLKEIPFTTGLHIADRVLSPRNNGHWHHFLEHVSATTLTSARLLDPTSKATTLVDEPEDKIGKDWILPLQMWDATLMDKAVRASKTDLLSAVLSEETEAATDEQQDAGYEHVVRRVCNEMLTPKNRPIWLNHLELVELIFRLHGRASSADQTAEYRQAIFDGQDPYTIIPVVNSVKLGLLRESMHLLQDFNGQEE